MKIKPLNYVDFENIELGLKTIIVQVHLPQHCRRDQSFRLPVI